MWCKNKNSDLSFLSGSKNLHASAAAAESKYSAEELEQLQDNHSA